MNLPSNLVSILQPLFDTLPLEQAMPELVPSGAPTGGGAGQYEDPRESAYQAALHAVDQLHDAPLLQTAIWLYVDDLDRSHTISENIHSAAGSYWQGIMHRREGDFSNAKYWFRQAGAVPFQLQGYDPYAFVDAVEAAGGGNPAELVGLQRREWAAFFEHCARGAYG